MTDVLLRDAGAHDVEVIHALAHDLAVFEHLEDSFVATVEQFREALFGPSAVARVIVAELDEQVVGMALFFPTFSTFLGQPGIWLEDLFVVPAFRGRGVARALIEELARRSPGRVEWEVLDWNADAIEVYEKLGATPFTGWTKYRMV